MPERHERARSLGAVVGQVARLVQIDVRIDAREPRRRGRNDGRGRRGRRGQESKKYRTLEAGRSGEKIVTEEETIILEAMIRSANRITDLDSAIEFAKQTAAKGSESLMGAANNIKGIAHELKYIKEENEDGDTIFAFMPDNTSYPKFDVLNVDKLTGVQEWVQS